MLNFSYTCKQEGALVIFRLTGFSTYNKLAEVKEDIVKKIKEKDNAGLPYKVLFDLRGLKALDPRAVEALHELDVVLYESSVIKVGTVMDSIIAKLQQLRVANQYPMDNALIFSDYDKCIAWINDETNLKVDPHTKKYGL